MFGDVLYFVPLFRNQHPVLFNILMFQDLIVVFRLYAKSSDFYLTQSINWYQMWASPRSTIASIIRPSHCTCEGGWRYKTRFLLWHTVVFVLHLN